MAAVLLLIFCSFGVGRKLLDVWGIPLRSGAFSIVAITVGMASISLLLFLLGSIGLFSALVFSLFSIPFVFFAVQDIIHYRNVYTSGVVRLFQHRIHGWDLFLLITAVVCVVLSGIACFAPITGGIANDEIGIHLSVPVDWLKNGSLAMLPYQVSFLAGHAELLFAYVLAFGGNEAPRLLSWVWMILVALFIFCMGKEFDSPRVGWLGALFFCINPLVFRTGMIAFTDFGMVLFCISTIFLLHYYCRTGNLKYALLAAFVVGVGCNIKASLYLYAPVLVIWLIYLQRQRMALSWKKIAVSNGLLILVAILSASAWPVRNYVLSGSPIFPPPLILYHFNNGQPIEMSSVSITKADAQDYLASYAERVEPFGKGLKNFFLLPWNITMHPKSFSIGDSMGTLVLALFPIVLLFGLKGWRLDIFILVALSVTSVYWLLIPEGRYCLPAILLAGLLCAWAVVWSHTRPVVKMIVYSIVALNALFGVAVCVRKCVPLITAVFIPQKSYELKTKEIPFFEAFSFVNNLPPSTTLVAPYGNQCYYYVQRKIIFDKTVFENPKKYPGSYVIDINWEQTTGRNIKNKHKDFFATAIPKEMDTVFAGIDAVVYHIGADNNISRTTPNNSP